MSIPLLCSVCGDDIGTGLTTITEARISVGCFYSSIDIFCPGKGMHPKPMRTEQKHLFGLLKKVSLKYPETMTNSEWHEYIGPKSKFLLWFAIVFGTEDLGVTVNGEWVWYDRQLGFFGKGLEELLKASAHWKINGTTGG